MATRTRQGEPFELASPTDTTYVIDMTGKTGTFIIVVHGRDTDSKEEMGVAAALALNFDTGELAGIPADPFMVNASAIDDSKEPVLNDVRSATSSSAE